MSASEYIQTGLDRIWSSDFVQKNPKKSYQAYHPDEYNRVKAYVEGGSEPNPFPTTLLGSGLALVERGRRQLAPPPPPPPPPPSTYTHRFATYDPVTDDVTGTYNRFSPAGTWWVPGTPEGNPWPQGGGIFPVTHATYGPGFRYVTTDEMLYLAAGSDSVIARNAVQTNPDFPDLRYPVSGSVHTWETTIMRPSGVTWPNKIYEAVVGMGFTHNSSPSGGPINTVGHHLYLDVNTNFPGFNYYVGRQYLTSTVSPPTADIWTRTGCPIPFNADEYHSIRWQIKWSDPGVANGFMKAWTSVNGGAYTQWLDAQNVVTKLSTFVEAYFNGHCSIRAARTAPPLTLYAYNMRVTIT